MSNEAKTSGVMFSEGRDVILMKLLEVKQQMDGAGVKKNARNDHLGNTYADINGIVETLDPVLTSVGLVSVTASRVDAESRLVVVDTTIIHAESGQWVMRSSAFEVANLAAQIVAGCETYARRYNHTGLFNLRAEDDDGNVATQAAPKGGNRPPSAKALKFAETMAAERGVEVPDEVREDSKTCSRFIDDLKQSPQPSPQAQSDATSGSQAFDKAKAHIEKSPVNELEAIRVQVEDHRVLTDSEKDRLTKLINNRLAA